MDVLIRYGFSIEEINHMMNTNLEIANIPDEDIYHFIDQLGQCGCFNNHIKNIFLTNPFCLSASSSEISKIVLVFQKIGFSDMSSLFESNPFFLNLNAKTFQDIIDAKEKEGLTLEQIRDYFRYYFDEVI